MNENEGKILRPNFGNAPLCALKDNIVAEIMKPEYDRLTIAEVLGVLFMVQTEMYNRNN